MDPNVICGAFIIIPLALIAGGFFLGWYFRGRRDLMRKLKLEYPQAFTREEK